MSARVIADRLYKILEKKYETNPIQYKNNQTIFDFFLDYEGQVKKWLSPPSTEGTGGTEKRITDEFDRSIAELFLDICKTLIGSNRDMPDLPDADVCIKHYMQNSKIIAYKD